MSSNSNSNRNHPNRRAPVVYEARGEWGGYEIRAGRRGWVVDRWSAVQGEITGRERLVYYGGDFPAGQDLEKGWNDYMTYGELLAVRSESLPGRTLRVGQRVF